jgi:fructose-1,6-bisphosphatase/sedoheptulose 1,7-bisphosphatase-like protein
VPRRRHAGQAAAAQRRRAPRRVYASDDLCSGDNIFFAATGITGGDLLRGVRYEGPYAYTHSMVLRSATGTMRFVDAFHEAAKLRARGVLGVQLDWKR